MRIENNTFFESIMLSKNPFDALNVLISIN